MKKVGILTFHWADNYGAVLQCCALKHYLCEQGFDARVINYWPEYALAKRVTRLGEGAVSRDFGVRLKGDPKIWLKLLLLNRLGTERRLMGHMDAFRSEKLLDGAEPLLNYEAVDGAASGCDFLISGSDQIWNPGLTGGRFDRCYFLHFTDHTAKRLSYAASMGVGLKPEWASDLEPLLRGYDAISTREQSLSAAIRDRFGIASSVVIDPVLLLDADYWSRNAHRPAARRPYILVYMLQRNLELVEAVNRLARQTGLPVVVIGSKQRYIHPEYQMGCPVEDFLGLFMDAEYIITNSFHGTAFSLLFHKRFLTFLDTNKPGRMIDLLTSLDLKERIFNHDNLSVALEWPDYAKVDVKLEEARRAAGLFLKENLK